MSDWPTKPEDIIREALREYVGDGDGADEAVLAAYTRKVKAEGWDEGREYEAEEAVQGWNGTASDNPYREEK